MFGTTRALLGASRYSPECINELIEVLGARFAFFFCSGVFVWSSLVTAGYLVILIWPFSPAAGLGCMAIGGADVVEGIEGIGEPVAEVDAFNASVPSSCCCCETRSLSGSTGYID